MDFRASSQARKAMSMKDSEGRESSCTGQIQEGFLHRNGGTPTILFPRLEKSLWQLRQEVQKGEIKCASCPDGRREKQSDQLTLGRKMFRAQSKTYKNFCGILAESKGQC